MYAACAMFRVKRVSTCIYGTTYDRYIIYIYMKIPPFDLLVWGSLRLAPITNYIVKLQVASQGREDAIT